MLLMHHYLHNKLKVKIMKMILENLVSCNNDRKENCSIASYCQIPPHCPYLKHWLYNNMDSAFLCPSSVQKWS